MPGGEKAAQLVQQLQLVLDRQFDVDALDAVGVFAHAVERNHDVLVDLERIGMLGDRRGTGAVEPEFLARFRTDGDETLADARIGHAYDFRYRPRHRILVVTDDIAEQGHFRQHAALGFGRVTHCTQVAFIQVLKARENGATLSSFGVEIILDLHDRWNRVARLAEKLQADRARKFRHLVQNPARRRDQAVAAFLLNAWQTGQEFVGDVLAQAFLAEYATLDFEDFRLERRIALAVRLGRMRPFELEARHRRIVDLAQVVIVARDFQPVADRIDRAPASQIVECRAPQYFLLAAGVHRDIAADTGRLGRSRIDRKYEAGLFRRIGHALGHHAGTGIHRRVFASDSRQNRHFDRPQVLELFGINDGRHRRERHGAAGIAGAAAARYDGQAQFDTRLPSAGHLLLANRRQDH